MDSSSASSRGKLPDSDWSQRRHPVSFRKLMSLKRIHTDQRSKDEFIFESLSSGYPPGATSRTYGGHVFAQAAWAASKTFSKRNEFFVHNITGHFLLLGDAGRPFRYHVQRIRDGGVYALRLVHVYQEGANGNRDEPACCFVATVSLKRDESRKRNVRIAFRHQEAPTDHIEREYRAVLHGKQFENHMIEAASDGLWSDEMTWDAWKQRGESFPGLEMRKVDMRRYNGKAVRGGEQVGKWRLLLFYRMVRDKDDVNGQGPQEAAGAEGDDDEEEEEDLNLHACAHLYASDRNSLFLAQRAHGYEDRHAQMGSLAHTVHFHASPKQLKMFDGATGQRKMYVQESWTSNSGEDRACHESRLWDCQSGLILATTKQDGMVRVPKHGKKPAYDGDTPPSLSKL